MATKKKNNEQKTAAKRRKRRAHESGDDLEETQTTGHSRPKAAEHVQNLLELHSLQGILLRKLVKEL